MEPDGRPAPSRKPPRAICGPQLDIHTELYKNRGYFGINYLIIKININKNNNIWNYMALSGRAKPKMPTSCRHFRFGVVGRYGSGFAVRAERRDQRGEADAHPWGWAIPSGLISNRLFG